MQTPTQKMRVDKWLWAARFFKTRSLSSATVSAGHLRVNGQKTDKPAAKIGAGDVLTFNQAREIRVVKVLGLPHRRGPATEAQGFYEDLTPKPDESETPDENAVKMRTGGRPSKKARRQFDKIDHAALESAARLD